ncbi:ABC transporter C family member 1 [Tetrabaena socialis]|uniref:ABC transporter C family member 1 n=1 Tax=Tetrabaena socialis TaxID=47790 RepID=A0A2J7ZWN4_9CHLO|nr:ABC transporter C family member 1 [Tetrabaena socialis]|eukprot:PNH04669.1 ABC transporter C family member 1 [Tetrabaena socialis]
MEGQEGAGAALGHTDERTKLEAEMMAGMEVVKCSAWEEPLQERIEAARRRELAMLWRVSVMSSIVTFLLLGVPVIIPVITFGVFLAGGHTLDAAKAFTCLVLFNVRRIHGVVRHVHWFMVLYGMFTGSG